MTKLEESRRLKEQWRQRIWTVLAEAGVAGDPFGRIPAFETAEAAAHRLAELPEWHAASVLKVVPDRAQEPVRRLALEAGKTVYMAVPALARPEPFYRLKAEELEAKGATGAEAAVSRRALELGVAVQVSEIEPLDLVVLGSVVVNRHGARIGKGAGYSDIELALLTEGGMLGQETVVTTTVHSLQIVDDELPEAGHDFRVDLVISEEEVADSRPGSSQGRPRGLVWEHLDEEKIQAIPVLRAKTSR